MSNSSVMRDRLMNEFAENYMEKIFYFCLKKTGDQYEAEDLTQDIALQIITSLHGGTIPTSFFRLGMADRAQPLFALGGTKT